MHASEWQQGQGSYKTLFGEPCNLYGRLLDTQDSYGRPFWDMAKMLQKLGQQEVREAKAKVWQGKKKKRGH